MELKHWLFLLQALCFYLETAALLLFLRSFYDNDFQWGIKKGIFLFVTAIAMAFCTYFENHILAKILQIPTLLAVMILPIYDYRGKKIVGFFRYFFKELFIILCVGPMILSVLPYYFPSYDPLAVEYTPQEYLFALIVQNILFGVLFLLLRFGVYKRGLVIKVGKRERIFNTIYALSVIICGFVLLENKKDSQTAMILLASTYIFAYILLPILVYSLRVSEHYRQRTKMQEVYLQSELEHFRQYMHAQEETRRFRHDIRNNLLCMSEMVASGDYEKLSQHLKDMIEITDSLSFKYVTGDVLLDSILNSKAQVMEKESIRFELDGVLAGGLSWKPMDICAVFANAIDNAIEACQKVKPENRHISMKIKSTPQFWLITVENSVAKMVDTKKLFQKNGGYTSKSDSSRHGIGTYSMKQTIESYGAIMTAECTDQVFTLEIMIDKNQ